MNPVMIRQGDVLLVPAKRQPGTLKEVKHDNGSVVLAYGEQTGHAHKINANSGVALLERKLVATSGQHTDQRFLQVLTEGGVKLTHEEHAAVTVPPGFYEVRMQREYTTTDLRERGALRSHTRPRFFVD
jgi:hypothetical protein